VRNFFILLVGLMLINGSAIAESPKKLSQRVLSTKNGLQYMTGGIGEEEAAIMRANAKKYTLNLLFSEGTSGRWVTDLNVNIYNEQSEMFFRIIGSKPMLYVNLPAGTYTILANNNGQKLRHKFTVDEGVNQRIILNWKDSLIEEDMPLDAEGN
jgi:hypothetical protein